MLETRDIQELPTSELVLQQASRFHNVAYHTPLGYPGIPEWKANLVRYL